jgi:large subunit ribosomal protein L1
MKRGKQIKEAREKVDKTELYSVEDAVKMMKDLKFTKFNESVDLSLKIIHKTYQNIRGSVVLPAGNGKEKKVLVLCKGDKQKEAQDAGADYVGAEEMIDKIKEGWIDFQAVVATPDMMKHVGKLGPILGRKGLMPKPKNGTVTDDVKGIINELKGGRIDYKTDKTGVIHVMVGNVGFTDEDIAANIKIFFKQVLKDKPSEAKGNYIKSLHVSSSMGPGIKINHKGIER